MTLGYELGAGGSSTAEPYPGAGLLVVDVGDLITAINHVEAYWLLGDPPLAMRAGDRALAKATALAAKAAHRSGVIADRLIAVRAADARARDHHPRGGPR